MKRARRGNIGVPVTLAGIVAALVLGFAGCSNTTSDDAHYTGPAGKLFPPDAERVGSHRPPPHVPSESRAIAPQGHRQVQTSAGATRAEPASPAPVAPTPGPAAARLVPAPPATDEVLEHRIYRPEGEKVGNDLELRIERLWIENGFTFAQLHVRNTSPHELEEITIKCIASGKQHVNLDFREQTLLTRADGRMQPGFQKSMKIRFERAGLDIREMSCTAKGW